MNVRNYIHLTGNLGAKPTNLVLPSGDLLCKFSLATNNNYRNKDGERVQQTEWHTVKAYGKLAELFTQYLEKGSGISVVGSMRYRKWEDKFGQPRVAAEVIAEEFTFLNSPQTETNDTGSVTVYPSAEAAAADEFAGMVDAEIQEAMEADTSRPAKKATARRNRTSKSASTQVA